MLREDGEACVQACEIRNYVDPHFRKKKDMLQLARRMALAGMLCRTAVKGGRGRALLRREEGGAGGGRARGDPEAGVRPEALQHAMA
eukprot:4913465-Pyramimonas_sp.AAC.1